MSNDVVLAETPLFAVTGIRNLEQAQRLVIKLLKVNVKEGCWNWIQSVGKAGYGTVRVGHSKGFDAHRLSYLLHKGEIPQGLCVLHTCDNRRCINPDHLWLGTKKQNTHDMMAKGRYVPPMSLRTHCPKGHPYNALNTYGSRICRVCINSRRRKVKV